MGPVAGLAAGLGLAALASHFGFGEELASFMMMALLAVVVMAAVGFFLRKRARRKTLPWPAPMRAARPMRPSTRPTGSSRAKPQRAATMWPCPLPRRVAPSPMRSPHPVTFLPISTWQASMP